MRHNRGFTLLEVIVAMAVLAIAGLSLIQAGNAHLGHVSHLERNAVADWVADNVLVDARLKSKLEASQGQVTMAGRVWYWRIVLGQPNRWLIPFQVEIRLSPDQNPIITRVSYLGRSES
ncbi:type II secretion system minor pseudopilin GspI [Celerinatantimonas sp. YJH-8]|uniref:type II secretion system minor pseudopilin GspI n=1 Tax=Celerinatantimonas sp. YJH-8 TaxID=3228714 RepID=UPI0038C148EA